MLLQVVPPVDPVMAILEKLTSQSPLFALLALAAWAWWKMRGEGDGAHEAVKAIADAGVQIKSLEARIASLEAEKAARLQSERDAALVERTAAAVRAERVTGEHGLPPRDR